MSIKNRFLILISLLLIVSTMFLLYSLGGNVDYILKKRTIKILTMIVVGASIAYSSVVFQTITANKILTPSIMGFEAVYLLFQTIIVFIYGDKSFQVLGNAGNFFISVFFMVLFSIIMYVLIFRKGNQNMYFLLLIGLILGSLFSTLSAFMQLIIDPNEFTIIEGKMFASFNNINNDLFSFAAVLMIITFIIGARSIKSLDVISLGKENAISLGVNYNSVVQKYLIIISILVSVSTALVGPITFLGILVTNLTYELFKTYKHSILISACCLISCISIIGGQFLVEHLFNFSTTISIIINFIGGVYFLYLLMKIKKS